MDTPTKRQNLILGFDIGTHKCGWAAVTAEGERHDSGAWAFKGNVLSRRLRQLRLQLEHLGSLVASLEEHAIIAAGIEKPFVWRNPQTTAVLSLACGIAACVLDQRDIPWVWVTPAEVRSIFGLQAKTQKEVVQGYIKLRLGLSDGLSDASDASSDELDALGIALYVQGVITRKKWEERCQR